MIIGRCIGETSLITINFLSKDMPKVGEYVVLKYDDKRILGMIESLVRGNVALNDDFHDPDTVEMIKNIEGDDYYIKGKIKILGDIDDNLRLPRTPAPPGTPVETAEDYILEQLFDIPNSISLGRLINQEDVEVRVDVNKMVTRHLAILAMTGAGKSNAVSVIMDELLKLSGVILVFDMHSEYSEAEFTNGEVNLIKPSINPIYMSFSEIKELANIKSQAHLQERYFRKAFKEAKEIIHDGKSHTNDFLELIHDVLYNQYNSKELASEKSKIMDVINKIDDLRDKYGNLFNTNGPNIISKIKSSKVNVLDLGQSDENTAEVIVSHILRNALKERKNFVHGIEENSYDLPIFFIIEEAHILAPKSRNTESKYWISRIAREGRKFGLGLCLVSQSPKSLDPDTLSQANNMIILRLVEPQDQRHVQSASENLSEDLLQQLPSLNIGEAVVLGLMSKIPTLIKINEFKGRRHGGDIDVVDIWSKNKENLKNEIDDAEKELLDLGYNY